MFGVGRVGHIGQQYGTKAPAFVPSDIPGMVLWLDAGDPSTILQSNNFVSQWNDKSGNGNHLTQSVGSAQPQYVENGLDGTRPTIRFNGTQRLEKTEGFSPMTSCTVFVAFANRVETLPKDNIQAILSSCIPGTSPPGMGMGAKVYAEQITRQIDFEGTASSFLGYKNGVAGLPGKIPGSATFFEKDEVLIAAAKISGFADMSRLKVGTLWDNTLGGQNDQSEIHIFNRIISDSEFEQLNNYMKTRWGVQ